MTVRSRYHLHQPPASFLLLLSSCLPSSCLPSSGLSTTATPVQLFINVTADDVVTRQPPFNFQLLGTRPEACHAARNFTC